MTSKELDGRTALTRWLEGERVFLDLGTHAVVPDIPGLARLGLSLMSRRSNSTGCAHLVVLGGGYVGLELAQAFRRFGSEVTVVERGRSFWPARTRTSPRRYARSSWRKASMWPSKAKPIAVEGTSGEKVRLRVATQDGLRVIEGSDLLVSAGRTPNTDGIGLDIPASS